MRARRKCSSVVNTRLSCGLSSNTLQKFRNFGRSARLGENEVHSFQCFHSRAYSALRRLQQAYVGFVDTSELLLHRALGPAHVVLRYTSTRSCLLTSSSQSSLSPTSPPGTAQCPSGRESLSPTSLTAPERVCHPRHHPSLSPTPPPESVTHVTARPSPHSWRRVQVGIRAAACLLACLTASRAACLVSPGAESGLASDPLLAAGRSAGQPAD